MRFWGLFIFMLTIQVGLIAKDTLTVSPEGKIKTIAEAVSMSANGDIIVVMPGIYFENNIVIDKPLHILGVEYPIIDGSEKEEDVFQVFSNHVTIEGLHIQNVKTNYLKELAGITLSNVHSCTIKNNRLTNTFFGIYLKKVTQSEITGNELIGNATDEASSGNALHMWYCKKITISGNTLKKHRDGIYIEFTDSTTVVDNHSEDNLRYGLHYMFSNHNQFINNAFIANGAGVAVMFSQKMVMRNNRFINNWGSAAYGMLLKEVRDGIISENTFKKNTVGIFAESANRLMFENNDFIENGWAMRMLGSCRENTISKNNFISNTFDIATNSSHNPNLYTGNYWSGYTGYDLEKNGIGDVPYHPVTLFSYLAEKVPESIVLQRSLFVHMINFAEKVAPAMTPKELKDEHPVMKPIKR